MEKIKAPVIVVLAILLAVWGILSCSSNSGKREAIISVLEQGHHANDGVSSIAEYVSKQGKISLRKCPDDFSAAYRKHQAAWRDMADVESEAGYFQQRYNSFSAYLEAFRRWMILDFNMVKDSDREEKRIKAHYDEASRAIKNTWYEVMDIADKYGVDTASYGSIFLPMQPPSM